MSCFLCFCKCSHGYRYAHFSSLFLSELCHRTNFICFYCTSHFPALIFFRSFVKIFPCLETISSLFICFVRPLNNAHRATAVLLVHFACILVQKLCCGVFLPFLSPWRLLVKTISNVPKKYKNYLSETAFSLNSVPIMCFLRFIDFQRFLVSRSS